jgi:hypothetical protein
MLVHRKTFEARWPGSESQFPGVKLEWGATDKAGFANLKNSQAVAMIYATGAPVPVDSTQKPMRTPHGWPPRGVKVEEPVAEDEIAAAPKKKSKKKVEA